MRKLMDPKWFPGPNVLLTSSNSKSSVRDAEEGTLFSIQLIF